MLTSIPKVSSNFSTSTSLLNSFKSDLLLVPHIKKEDSFETLLQALSASTLKTVLEIIQEEDFQSEFCSDLYLRHIDINQKRILLFGLGDIFESKEGSVTYLLEQGLVKVLQKNIKLKKLNTILVCLNQKITKKDTEALALAILGSLFLFSYRSKEALKSGPEIKEVVFTGSLVGDYPELFTQEKLFELCAISYSRNLAMDLVNSPPNIKNCETLAETSRFLSRFSQIKVQIQNDIEWIKKEMPSFYTVARGSLKSDPPQWLHLHYNTSHSSHERKKFNICLVGKSVLFDTGGYQLKPDSYMNTMKADMTGGASVLSVFETLAKHFTLNHLDVHAFLAATPNMVDANAFVPDSIISSTCGKKIEIKHTDAEGRLTLIDAVSMAEKLEPDLIITIATLTGSASRAVGPRIALMANHTKWQDVFQEISREAGDPIETLSVELEDYESIKSKLDSADLINDSHNKYRGAQTACAFIMSGVKKTQPLLHLDIAGGDMTSDGKATGIAVRALLLFLLRLDRDETLLNTMRQG